jgi:hypothetical protein
LGPSIYYQQQDKSYTTLQAQKKKRKKKKKPKNLKTLKPGLHGTWPASSLNLLPNNFVYIAKNHYLGIWNKSMAQLIILNRFLPPPHHHTPPFPRHTSIAELSAPRALGKGEWWTLPLI